ncbi:hypothetical protein LguiA_027827 [Lonicera macranthoides]
MITECKVNGLNLVSVENQNENLEDEEEDEDSGISVIVSIDDVARLVSVVVARDGGNGGTVGGVGVAGRDRDRVVALILVRDVDLLVAVMVVLGMVRDMVVVVVGREVGHVSVGSGDGAGKEGNRSVE